MPNIQSAKKRARQNIKLRLAKGSQRNQVITAVKKVIRQTTENKQKESRESFVKAQKLMDGSVNKKLFHKNKISRLKARLNRRIKAIMKNDPASPESESRETASPESESRETASPESESRETASPESQTESNTDTKNENIS